MEPIAIIGMACRLPGAPSLKDFWTLLRNGHHGIELVPESRWDCESRFDPDPNTCGKINTRHGGFIEGIDLFDNEFFNISHEEARQMDPQQRIILEVAYEAFEDAGVAPAKLEGMDAGVFVGVMSSDYLSRQTADDFRHIDQHTGAGSGYCMIANRISYQFNLRGPSMAIDSACSSSLSSTFMACTSLWTHQCSMALAAGVNLMLSPALNVFYTRNGLSAEDGMCRTFSDDAKGMVRGEGAGVVLLKRLSDAERDGDHVYAVIRGGSLNHNGRSNGIASPSHWAQQALLRRAYEHAEAAPGEIQYVELHGTGTLIGDAIEATALGSVLAEGRPLDRPCLVGSVKTNLGHLEGAAGVAGLIKLALCLHHGELVPSLWFKTPNRHIPFDTLPLKVQGQLQDWPSSQQPRLAAISSLGLGGANAHLVLQSAPRTRNSMVTTDLVSPNFEPLILQISARSQSALHQMAGRYADSMKEQTEEECCALCNSTLIRPQEHNYRATFVANRRNDLIAQLRALSCGAPSAGTFTGRYRLLPKRRRIFVFPDFKLLNFEATIASAAIHPCFNRALADCDAAIQEVLRSPIRPLMSLLAKSSDQYEERSFPFVHFGLQIALAALWREAGLEPDAVAGLGKGQIAAYFIAGSIELKGAIALIASANSEGLTQAGAQCMVRCQPPLIDCFCPNTPVGPVDLPNLKQPDHDLFITIPDLRVEKNADFIVLGLDAVPAERGLGADLCDSAFIGLSPQRFSMELARFSVRHNVKWRSFIGHRPLVHPPSYPWQRTRHWLDNTPPQETSNLQSISRRMDLAEAEMPTGARIQEGPSHRAEQRPSIEPPATRSRVSANFDKEQFLTLPEAERKLAIARYLRQQVAETLRVSEDELEDQPLTGLGIDSLSALQLKNRVEADLQVDVSVVKLLDGHSLGDLTADLLNARRDPAEKCPSPHSIGAGVPARPNSLDMNNLRSQIEAMPAEQIDRVLHELLANGPPLQPAS